MSVEESWVYSVKGIGWVGAETALPASLSPHHTPAHLQLPSPECQHFYFGVFYALCGIM